MVLVNLIILANTVTLSMDRYPINNNETAILNILN